MICSMKYRCPKCHSSKYRSHGQYFRKSDSKTILRWQCRNCRHIFSQASFSSCYRQHKRRINSLLNNLLSSGVSQRRAALVLKVTRKTIARKLIFLGRKSLQDHQAQLKLMDSKELMHLQLDDLITSHHSKLKPLSLSVIVSKESRRIIAGCLSEIPSFGRLAKLSRKKYGRRSNHLSKNIKDMCQSLSPYLPEYGRIDSDEHNAYPKIIEQCFPRWRHHRFKGQRASVVGQGELKMRGHDPLFSINHTLAMLRANMNRLFRRTWNTTKGPEHFMYHFWIYVRFHNKVLI